MEHLEPGGVELRLAGSERQAHTGERVERPIGVETTLGVGEHVEFDLSGAKSAELLGEGSIRVVEFVWVHPEA